MRSGRVALVAMAMLALLSPRSAGATDLSAETMAMVSDVLAPYRGAQADGANAIVARALGALRKEGFLDAARPAAPPSNIAETLGKALALGGRAQQFLPELAALNDAVVRGDDRAIRETIVAIYQKAGRTLPSGAALDKIVADARAAVGSLQPPHQRATISKPDHTIEIDDWPAIGKTKIDVVLKDGAEGGPARVTLSGDHVSHPDASGKGIQLTAQPSPARTVTPEDAAKARPKLNGKWIDQDGETWEIAGDGADLTLTQTYPNGHKLAYASKWDLSLVNGTHAINDPADVLDLPGDVAADLAANYHPPYTIALDFFPDQDRLTGSWASMTVSYDGMSHHITKVADPWQKPLILTREPAHVAQGGRWPQEGP